MIILNYPDYDYPETCLNHIMKLKSEKKKVLVVGTKTSRSYKFNNSVISLSLTSLERKVKEDPDHYTGRDLYTV
jgi:hypothetical protein